MQGYWRCRVLTVCCLVTRDQAAVAGTPPLPSMPASTLPACIAVSLSITNVDPVCLPAFLLLLLLLLPGI
jgi:hypothetical protein